MVVKATVTKPKVLVHHLGAQVPLAVIQTPVMTQNTEEVDKHLLKFVKLQALEFVFNNHDKCSKYSLYNINVVPVLYAK